MQHARPLVEGAHDAVTDAQVVLDQVELGRPDRGEIDPLGVGDPHDLVVDLDLDRLSVRRWLACHGPNASRGSRPPGRSSATPRSFIEIVDRGRAGEQGAAPGTSLGPVH